MLSVINFTYKKIYFLPSFNYTQFKAINLAVNTFYIFQKYFQLKFFFSINLIG